MIALISAVFLASLLGSLHCAGMCGAFVTIAMGLDEQPAPQWLLNAAYNGGRLVTYTILGGVAGAVGSAIDLGGSAIGLQRAAVVLAGLMMVTFGTIALLRVCGNHLPKMPLPKAWRTLLARAHRTAFGLKPVPRAAVIGLLTTLMPCGWLYAFAVTSAGTADPILGALTMAAFWIGTLPVMVSLGVSVHALSGMLRARLPLFTSLIMIAMGLYTVAARAALPSMAGSIIAIEPGDLTAAADRAGSLHETLPPCCRHDR